MPAIRHHVPDDLLMGYAAGVLPQAFDLVVATHVSLNDDARVRLAGYEELGGAVLSDISEAELAPDSLEQTLAKISRMQPTERSAPMGGVFPAPLRKMVGGDASAVKWKCIARGTKQAVLCADGDATARLLYIPAGQAMPEHSHRGTEMTLVLQGGYSSEDGHFQRGDLEVAGQQTHHTPIADDDGEDCICLVATDGRLRFDGLLPRIAQVFLRI